MPEASPDDVTSDTPPKKRRFRLRYSLRSLLLFVLLVNSACLLWMHWEPWTLETTLKGHCAAFSPDGTRVVTGSYDQTAIVWDTFTGKRLLVLKPVIAPVVNVGYSPNGKRIFTSFGRRTYAWDAETGKVHGDVSPSLPQRSVATMQDGTRYAVENSYEDIYVVTIWELLQPLPARRGKALYVWRAHESRVLSLDFSHDGKRLVTAGGRRTSKNMALPAS